MQFFEGQPVYPHCPYVATYTCLLNLYVGDVTDTTALNINHVTLNGPSLYLLLRRPIIIHLGQSGK